MTVTTNGIALAQVWLGIESSIYMDKGLNLEVSGAYRQTTAEPAAHTSRITGPPPCSSAYY